MYDTGIADRLRAAGLNVVEVAGWQTRGSAVFNPIGSLDHHTAGSAKGNAPSLTICIYGRSDLPGPLCQVLMGRDNTCYVIAAGRANHAGKGQWGYANSNVDLYGIERENVGTTVEPWRPDQTDAAARAHAALIRGRAGAGMVARHAEYALPAGRKPDTHSVNGSTLRDLVDKYLTKQGGQVPKPDPLLEEDDMIRVLARNNTPGLPYAALGDGYVIWFTDGPFTPNDSRDKVRPDDEYTAGVDAGYYHPVRWVDEGTFDNALETARNNLPNLVIADLGGAAGMRLAAVQQLLEAG